jgi:very-short-patch-repair endonuclease
MDLAKSARVMRQSLTPAEAALWKILRSPPLDRWHFRRQVPFKPLYIADFASQSARLVIEADGPSHEQIFAADTARTAWLGERGYAVIRFRNTDILTDPLSVWRDICAHVATRGPPPRSR